MESSGAPLPIISDTKFETELHFECLWFENAWEELNALASQGFSPVRKDPLSHNLKAWSMVDRMLVHAARVQRLIDPDKQGYMESAESWNARTRFATEFARRINPDLIRSRDLMRARAIVEHANAYLEDFSRAHRGQDTATFSMAWGEEEGLRSRYPAFRSYRHSTGKCVVFGHPVNLRSVREIIREIKERTHPHVVSDVREKISVPKLDLWKLPAPGKGETAESKRPEGYG